MDPTQVHVGLIGCGIVGQGLLELLERQREDLLERFGLLISIDRLAVRDTSKDRGPLAASIAKTDNPLALAEDPKIDLIVEVAGSPKAMGPVLLAALKNRKPVVTANKALVAEQLAQLASQAQHSQTPFACEAAAAGAIPILHALGRRVDRVQRLLGIVNGTSNFILTRMEQDELQLADAVRRAQHLGLAEADPSADIDGLDAAAKLSILAYRSFGRWAQPSRFTVRGIRALSPADCDLARSLGFRIRHLAQAEVREDASLLLEVGPTLLPDWHLLAGVEEEYNAIYLSTESAGDLSFFGKGAGGLPTATAVLGDIVELARPGRPSWSPPAQAQLQDSAQIARRRFLRVSAERHPALGERIEAQLRRAGLVVHNRATFGNSARRQLGFLTSPVSERGLTEVLERINAMGRVDDTLSLPVLEG